jgi:hypothetical protein
MLMSLLKLLFILPGWSKVLLLATLLATCHVCTQANAFGPDCYCTDHSISTGINVLFTADVNACYSTSADQVMIDSGAGVCVCVSY